MTMRKWHVCLGVGVSVLLFWWQAAPSSQTQLFDSKKSQQELEIMKGILRTTLDFAAKELRGTGGDDKQRRFDFGGFSNISAFYLYGQGAVFSIPTSSLRHSFNFHWEGLKGSLDGLQSSSAALSGPPDVHIDLGNLNAQIQDEVERANEEVDRAREEVERAQEEIDRAREREQEVNAPNSAPPPAPAAPAAPAPAAPTAPQKPAPPASPKRARTATPKAELTPERREQLRRRLAEAQERVKKRQEELEQSQARFREQLAEIKVYLIEALANHGDSLSVVRPNEYLNLVIAEDGGEGFFSNGSHGRREVISVQKSVITDYKAGRINLEAFKQKVLDYSN
jgi:molecular chaperone GrpE (heat shock protein)